MLTGNAFHKFLFLLPLAFPNRAPLKDEDGESSSATSSVSASGWSYDNIDEWGDISPACNGIRQSPIHLKTSNSLFRPLPPLRFGNYDIPFEGPATVTNNGHSISMTIPPTRSSRQPFVTGGMMRSIYEAQSLHFHWGSKGVKGSEHKINDRKFDVEMHIVHKNVKYPTQEEAVEHKDGLAVLGIMFRIVTNPDRFYPGLNKIFNVLPLLREYHSETTINGQLTLGQFLGDLNTKNFFTYSGSLTTPPCSEAVIWSVFPEPLPVGYSQIKKFWNILDSHGDLLLDNFRPLQPRENRPVYYRSTAIVNPVFFPQ